MGGGEGRNVGMDLGEEELVSVVESRLGIDTFLKRGETDSDRWDQTVRANESKRVSAS